MTIYAYAISAILIASKYGANNYSTYNHVDSFGRVLVNSFPENSVILMKGRIKSLEVNYNFDNFTDLITKIWIKFQKNPYKGDLPSNTFRYLELVEKVRPDLTFIDTQPMTYDWYLKNQGERFSHLDFPGSKYRLEGDNTFSMADLIKANPSVNGDLSMHFLKFLFFRSWPMFLSVNQRFRPKSSLNS